MATMSLRLETGTAENRLMFVPSPTSPTTLKPQLSTLPVLVRITPLKPSDRTAPLATPTTGTGTFDWVMLVSPLPSSPLTLRPQQEAVPEENRAQLMSPPPAPPLTAVVSPGTGAGVTRVVTVPSPSAPKR